MPGRCSAVDLMPRMTNCMEAQPIRIALHDESKGFEVSPRRVPLAVLQRFVRDVDEFLRGDGGEAELKDIEVAVVEGSLAVQTAPVANPGLLQDLRRLASSESIDGLSPRRRAVVERWQKAARSGSVRFEVSSPHLPSPVYINLRTDYHADDADQWVRVERYVKGEIEDMGGDKRVNAHIRLPDGRMLIVDADRQVLRDEKVNRLYKAAMVRISAEYNVVTREYRGARLLEFVEHETRPDERGLERLKQRGAKAWSDVPDAGEWVDRQRGNDA